MNAQMNVRARDKSSSRKRCFLNFGVLIFPVLLMLYLAPRTPLRLNQMARSHTLSHVSDEVCYASMKSCSMEAATSTGVYLSLKLPVNLRTELSHRKLGDGHAVKKAGSRHMTRSVRRTIKSSPKHLIREAQNQKI